MRINAFDFIFSYKKSKLDLFSLPFLYFRIFLWAMMIYKDNWTLCHINSWSLLQPVASITRHIDGDIALTNDDEDNNGNAFFERDISLQQCILLFCACGICFFWYFFLSEWLSILPFKVKTKQDKMDDL